MKRGILCSGYGAQYAGMGKDLYDDHRVVQEYFEEASDCSGINFVKLCFASSDAELAQINHAALVLYLWGAASSALLRHDAIAVDSVAGCDIASWYSALHSVGAVTFPDGLYILRKWGELYAAYSEQSTQSFITISSSDIAVRRMLETVCNDMQSKEMFVRISYITPNIVTVIGTREELDVYVHTVQQRDHALNIEHHRAYESPVVFLPEDMIAQLLHYLEKIDFHEPQRPVASPLINEWLTTQESLKATARELFSQPFRVDLVMRSLRSFEEIICAVPSLKTRSHYTVWLPQCKLWVMDTKEELRAMSDSLAEKREEEVPT